MLTIMKSKLTEILHTILLYNRINVKRLIVQVECKDHTRKDQH